MNFEEYKKRRDDIIIRYRRKEISYEEMDREWDELIKEYEEG